jgi:hypothetical protein
MTRPSEDLQDATAQGPRRWEIDRRVPLATLIALVAWAFLGSIYGSRWVSDVEHATQSNTDRITKLEQLADQQSTSIALLLQDMARLSAKIDGLQESTRRIESLLERLVYGAGPKP